MFSKYALRVSDGQFVELPAPVDTSLLQRGQNGMFYGQDANGQLYFFGLPVGQGGGGLSGLSGLGETITEALSRLTAQVNATMARFTGGSTSNSGGLIGRVASSGSTSGNPNAVGRGDVIDVHLDLTYAGTPVGNSAYSTFRANLEREGFTIVFLNPNEGWTWDSVDMRLQVTSGGFGALTDAAQLVAGIASNSGLGVSYSAGSPLARFVMRADPTTQTLRPTDQQQLVNWISTNGNNKDDEDDTPKILGLSMNMLLIGGGLLLVLALRN